MEKRTLSSSFVVSAKDDTASSEQDEAVSDLRKKVAILRKALLGEREKLQVATKRVGELEATNSLLEVTLQEKDARIQDLQAEMSAVASDLRLERDKVEEFISSPQKTKNKGSKAALEQQNRRLLEEHHSKSQKLLEMERLLSELRL
jgi:hypothetical protein